MNGLTSGSLASHDFDEAASIGAVNSATPPCWRPSLDSGFRRWHGVRGQKESALALAREAYELAFAEGDWPRAHSAVGQLLLACLAWWNVENASRLAATSLELTQRVRRCGALPITSISPRYYRTCANDILTQSTILRGQPKRTTALRRARYSSIT